MTDEEIVESIIQIASSFGISCDDASYIVKSFENFGKEYMMSNIEDDVKVLEKFMNNEMQRDKLERDNRCGGWKIGDIYKLLELNPAINNLLSEREQLLKEKKDDKQDIKDFHNALNEENLRCANYAIENNELKKRIKELEAKLEFKKYGDLDEIEFEEYMSHFIPKQKVKDKIEDIKKGNYSSNYNFKGGRENGKNFKFGFKVGMLKALKELLEEVTITEEYSQNEQFIFIDESHIGDIVIYRCYDKDTKVIYMFTGSNYSKLTVMVDADGKPLLYEEENNNE